MCVQVDKISACSYIKFEFFLICLMGKIISITQEKRLAPNMVYFDL